MYIRDVLDKLNDAEIGYIMIFSGIGLVSGNCHPLTAVNDAIVTEKPYVISPLYRETEVIDYKLLSTDEYNKVILGGSGITVDMYGWKHFPILCVLIETDENYREFEEVDYSNSQRMMDFGILDS